MLPTVRCVPIAAAHCKTRGGTRFWAKYWCEHFFPGSVFFLESAIARPRFQHFYVTEIDYPHNKDDEKFWKFWNPSKIRRDRSIWVWNFHPKPPIFLISLYISFTNTKEIKQIKGNQENPRFWREIPNSDRPISVIFWWISKITIFLNRELCPLERGMP